MKKKQITIILTLFLILTKAQAQDTDHRDVQTDHLKNQIGLEAGLNFGYLKDLNFSPLNYTENGQVFGLTYQRKNEKLILSAKLNYGSGNVNNDLVESFRSNYLRGSVALKCMKRVQKIQSSKFNLYLGGQYRFQILYLDWDDQSAFSFFANHSFDFSALFNYQFNSKNNVSANINIPLLSLIVRPPFNGIDEELFANDYYGRPLKLITNGYWGSFNKLVSSCLTLRYNHQLSDRFDLVFSYRIIYQTTFETNKFIQFSNQLNIGANFNF